MARKPTSLQAAAWGHKNSDKRNRPDPRRRKLPADRAIHWIPRDLAESGQDAYRKRHPYEFFLRRAALAGINRHVLSADGEPRFGFLLGHTCRCPNTGVQYSLVDTALAAREVFEEEAPAEVLARAWEEARHVFEGHSGQLLGWYHSHHLLGLMSSEADEQANKELFGKPWQASVIVVPGKNGQLGGVFRHDPSSSIGERRQPAPFHELLENAVPLEEMKSASVMAWTNYVPASEVTVETRELAEVPDRESANPEMPVRRPHATRPVSLVIPSEGAEFGLIPAFRRRPLWPLGVFAMVMLFVALLTVARGLERTPVTNISQTRTVYSLEERRFFDAVDGLGVAVERYAERSADFDAARIGCDLLAIGYVAADATFVRIAARYADLGANPKQAAVDAYGRASTEMAVINAHFDGSGCPRP